MSDSGFIFLLALGATLLGGILAVAHLSAYRLSKRIRERRSPPGEPEFDFGGAGAGYVGMTSLKAGKLILHDTATRHEPH